MDIEKDEEIGSPLLSKAITNAQKKIESLNFASREQLLKYDMVNCKQREELYEMRNIFLKNDNVEDVLFVLCGWFYCGYLKWAIITQTCIKFNVCLAYARMQISWQMATKRIPRILNRN